MPLQVLGQGLGDILAGLEQPRPHRLRQDAQITRKSPRHKAHMPALCRLPQAHRRRHLLRARQALGRDEGIVAGVEQQGRDAQAGQAWQGTGAAPVIGRVGKAMQGRQTCLACDMWLQAMETIDRRRLALLGPRCVRADIAAVP